jgi:hypothetical protein
MGSPRNPQVLGVKALGIAEGNAPERAESVGIGLIAGKTYDGNSASVKIAGAR